jgi:mono/diheme cytochrome c family protein
MYVRRATDQDHRWCGRPVPFGMLAVLAALAGPLDLARADLTASYQGRFTIARTRQQVDVTATLTQWGTALRGTVTVSGVPLGGTFVVHGRVRGRRLTLSGADTMGVRLAWKGGLAGQRLVGRARLRGPRARARGLLVLARGAAAGGSGGGGGALCEPAFFTGEVMGKVLVPICSRCHVAGGVAQAARLRVTPSDPVATQQSVALVIDTAAPQASLLLEKPLGLVSHGGGQQIAPGGAEADILTQWVTMVAQGLCASAGGGGGGASPGSGGPGADLFATDCAGCHGADARGLPGYPDIHCARSIHDTVRNGVAGPAGTMPAFPSLTDADIARLQTFLDGLCPAGAATGADLYAGNCATCHGPTGGGGRNALGVHGEDIRCAGVREIAKMVTRGGDGMPAFPGLDAADIDAIASWLMGYCTGGDS